MREKIEGIVVFTVVVIIALVIDYKGSKKLNQLLKEEKEKEPV